MASLYDRLNRMQPAAGQARKPQVKPDLLVETTLVPLEHPLPEALDAQTLNSLSAGRLRQPLAPERLLFLDTETTGLSRGAGTLAFLIGYGQFVGHQLRITQVLMRDYPQEPQLLEDLMNRVAASHLLLTYNGSSFDLPLLTSRLTMNRQRLGLDGQPHLDLLHAARRVYKLRLGRCPLTRLEEAVFGFSRENDLPGAQVPERYFSYLKTQDEGLLRDVLDHNRQDILTLALLFLRLATLHAQPETATHQQDLFSLGCAFERGGDAQRAMTCYRACTERDVREMARLRMAELYRRQRQDEQAASLYESLHLQGSLSPQVYISLAKIYEHRFRDPARALEITRQGMIYCYEHRGQDAVDDPGFKDLEQRSLRLIRKVEKKR
ncbi:MAG: ribonuclease H-like domain-containing protein [Clostridiales bacterium]|nr:ribonuclease H-like domain-containing protein [Clostridiales bacterium]